VSPVFRHGRLRLYLLKLLDESPRHGYEVIRLLQDRFLGVYAPSPGTIYPRLARLEEDGLVTHEEVDGKKIYSITDKGREEIRSRLGELADLEDELTESLRDVAREISEDVRDTVRSIREELASAAREFRVQQQGRATREHPAEPEAGDWASATEQRSEGPEADDARRIRDQARRSREQMRASFRAHGRGRGDWAERTGRPDWTVWGGWADWGGSGDTGTTEQDTGAGEGATGESRPSGAGSGRRPPRGQNPFSDLERIAIQFATELRAAAKHTGDLGERSLNDLRDILTDTLAKVRVEIFTDTDSATRRSSEAADKPDATTARPGSDRTEGSRSEGRPPGDPEDAAGSATKQSGGQDDDAGQGQAG
jgi:DNA-binding PadR family transcriptional regulator